MRLLRASMVLIIFLIPGGSACAEEPLKLGVHPYLPATEIVKRFTPLAKYLEKKTGHRVEVFVSSDYAHHTELIGKGERDIAYMGPASYVKLTEKYGHKPILARLEVAGSPSFRGVIIARDD